MTEQLAADVGHDVVANNERSGDEEPDEALEDVVDNEMAVISHLVERFISPGNHDQKEGDVNPAEQSKLLAKILALEIGHKADETEHIQHEADEAVVLGEGNEIGIDEDDVLEVIDDRLAVEEVVGDNEEVPNM